MKTTYREAKESAPKGKDTWFRVLLVNPIAIPLVYLIARHTNVTSIGLTLLAYLFGTLAALAFGIGDLLTGGVLYYLRFLLDAMDGKLARVKQEDDTFRGSMDFLGDGIVDVLVVIGLAIHGDATLLFLFVLWMCVCYLIHRFTSLSYRLMNQRGIAGKEFASPEMREVYGNSSLISWYYRLTSKLEKWKLNTIPSAAESSVLMFIVGPILWELTGMISLMHIFTGIGIFVALPVTLGTGLIAYRLSRRGTLGDER